MSGKLQKDIVWNLASVCIMGVSGILLNIIIALFYDSAMLGVFNQVYAIYIFASQLAVLGLPPSALKYVAEFSEDQNELREIIVSAVLLVASMGAVVSVSLWLTSGVLGRLLSSRGVSLGLSWVAPGLFFFALNKVFLSVINGFRWMKLFAILQSLRYILMILVCLILAFNAWPGESLSVIFTLAEAILFIICMIVLGRTIYYPGLGSIKKWIKKHIEFGLKSFFSTMLLELNTRVDVLMLGYFVSDSVVGIYSFAAMLAEGVFQFLAVVMRNVTPILVKLVADKKLEELREFIREGKRTGYRIMTTCGLILVLTYPYWIRLITNRAEFQKGWPIFAILVAGIVSVSGYLPFRNILQAADLPGWHTIMIIILVSINVMLNSVFIPMWQMTGAAVATACSTISLIFLLKVFARWKLQFDDYHIQPLF
jgi:O-antigen/teichoic acid export membrane protein